MAPRRPNGDGRGNGDHVLGAAARRRRRQRRRRERAGSRRFLAALGALLVVGTVGGLAAAAMTGAAAFASGCDLASLKPVAIGRNSFVYAANGSVLGAIPAERNRQPIGMSEMSPWIPKAAVAIEDRRFYDHGGVDVEGILRAAWKNVQSGEIVEGGSTITQQLVRNLYISREQSLTRKIKEACLAIKLDNAWSKDRILQTYLNQVYFGNHAYGVEAAAQTYFSKPAKELNIAEAALVVGLPQAPSVYDPFRRLPEAVRRRNEVLRAMLVNRDITRAQYDEAVARAPDLKPGQLYTRIREPYFFSYVRERLIATYGAQTVRSGGLRVYTTIDPRFQRLAKKAVADTLTEKDDPASAIVSINPANGAIRAMVAEAPGREHLIFNLAAQGRRQAGSSFKTFVLVESIREGINPHSTSYLSAPFTWQPDPTCTKQMDPNCVWEVATYSHTYSGPMSIARATLASDNTVYARLTLDIGPEKVVEVAHRMGIKTKLQPVASIGLGSNSVSVLEMASAYATLAAGGIYSEPMAIRKVVLANGETDDQAGWGEPERKRVLPDWVAAEATGILEQNMLYGTGTGAYFGRPAAGKTGTTDNFADAWFVGYTPTLSTAVWIGYPNAQIEMRSVHGISVSGGSFPATIWRLFVSAALEPTKPVDFPVPKSAPVWLPWEGEYQLEGLEETTSTGETGTGETETGATEPSAGTTGAEPLPGTTGAEPAPGTTGAEPAQPAATTTETQPTVTGAAQAAVTTE